MKTTRFLFSMMIAAVSLQGVILAAQASPAPQQATSQSSEKSADQQKDEVRNEKDQARPKEADENLERSDMTRTPTKRRPSESHSKRVPSHQPRPAKTPITNSPRTDAPGSVAALQPMGSNAATNVPKKVVTHYRSALPSAVSVNGQQFKNSRDPGAHLAVSGGPPASPRGTAAINGTNVKRK